MATTVTISYEDGHEDQVTLKAVDMVKAERHFKGTLPNIEGTLYAAYQKLRPGTNFDTWLDQVDKMDVDSDETDPLAEGP